MKTHIASQHDSKAKPRRRFTKKQRGVAIITVLAVIVLMSALVLSFFQMSQSEQVSSKINADVLRSYSLRDTAINLAIGQIREATAPTTASINGRALWTSQPGLIRTFQKDGSNGMNFKLYSAMNMVVDGNGTDEGMISEDQAIDWKTKPEVWEDLNKPVYRPKVNAKSAVSQQRASDSGTAIYPIIDPASYDPSRDSHDAAQPNADVNPEGFRYQSSSKVSGVSPEQKTLPMPVRWLYLLEDGSVGFLSPSGKFTAQVLSAGNATGGAPSPNNPIVGRIAFWADDESCKININTASEGVFWDTPRCDTPEERFYANCQPTANEFQRFPGHPAGVCLSSVLFPKKRYYASGPVDSSGNNLFVQDGKAAPFVDKSYKPMTTEELRFIWDLSPMISYRSEKADAQNDFGGGTVGGVVAPTSKMITRVNISNPTLKLDISQKVNPDDHLYTSVDEWLFRAKKSTSAAGGASTAEDKPRRTWANSLSGSALALTEEKLIERVSRAKFLLTTKSSAPEANVWGHPRICLWPVFEDVPHLTSSLNTGSISGANYTAFDTVVSLTAQLSDTNYYYIVRRDPNSRHTEFYGRGQEPLNGGIGQNELLRRYLFTALGGSSGGNSVGKLPGVVGKNTFLTKYHSNTAGDSKNSDMNNLIVNMLDYIRMTNLADPALAADKRYGYSAGNNYPGQVTAFCGCGSAAIHESNWPVAQSPDPKGVGRTIAPTRMHFIIMKASNAVTNASAPQVPTPNNNIDYQGAAQDPTGKYVDGAIIYEMGILVEGAAPAQGLACLNPSMFVGIGGGNPASPTKDEKATIPGLTFANSEGLRPANRKLTAQLPGVQTTNIGSIQVAGSLFSTAWPTTIPNYGGSLGFRAFSNPNTASNTSLILFKPFAIVDPSGGKPLKFLPSLDAADAADATGDKWQTAKMFRLMVFDGTPGVGNLVQAYYFNFGKPYTEVAFGLPTVTSSQTLNSMVASAYGGGWSYLSSLADSGQLSIHTMVMPHGDHRAIIARRVLGNVAGNKYSIKAADQPLHNPEVDNRIKYGVATSDHVWNSFVPSPNFGNGGTKGYLGYDPNPARNSGGIFDASVVPADPSSPNTRTHLAMSPPPGKLDKTKHLLPPNAIMDYPFEYKDYQHLFETVHRKKRGSMDPAITGDFDNGVANTPDGCYINKADEGDLRPDFSSTGSPNSSPNRDTPYFGAPGGGKSIGTVGLRQGEPNRSFTNITQGAMGSSPSRMIKGPVQFGSLPSGSSTNAVWQNLMFRPDPFAGDPNYTSVPSDATWSNRHFGNGLNPEHPKDHLLLDFFWMPVVEPYALSDTFSTKGKINMNYKIFPFDYIHRSTALHALFKAEKLLAIPTEAAATYKCETPADTTINEYTGNDTTTGSTLPEPKATWRKHIHAEKTLWQFERKFNKQGEFSTDNSRAFRTPSEICDLWLIPESLGVSSAAGLTQQSENPYQIMRKFWIGADVSNSQAATFGGTSAADKRTEITGLKTGHRLTGDNSKEAPYANLYPRLTTKSNVFKIHYTVQTIQKARSTDADKFVPGVDQITSEHRGSAIVERTLDMTNPALKAVRYLSDPSVFTDPKKRLDYFYSYRITEMRQFAP